jgi:predicted nuclease of predicted toxin-antitoxin system
MKNEDYKFIIDVGVGRIIETWLTEQHFMVIGIRSLNAEMADTEIIQLANKEDAIIITMDKDFGDLIFKSKIQHKGVLLLRLEDAVAEEKLAVIQNIFPEHLLSIKNNFAVYQNGRLRIRTT